MTSKQIEISECEVCGNTKLLSVLNLGLHPMCDDLVKVGNERVCKEYPIEIVYCENCKTAHQLYQIPKNELFPKEYHYRSRFTSDVLRGMEDLVGVCKLIIGDLKEKKVIDIGCNDGSLLDFFRKEGAETFGLEPTDAYKDALSKGHTIYGDFLTVDVAKNIVSKSGNFDVISFTNVFAHIEDLKEVLNAVSELMHDKSAVVIENHYLGAVLDKNQFDTFYHEHPRTYSYSSFEIIADSLGLDLLSVEFPSRYGGNIRVVMGKRENYTIKHFQKEEILNLESLFLEQFNKMNENIELWKVFKKEELLLLKNQNGKLKAKAFPGRAAILVKLLNLDENIIEAVYEKPGSMKIGHYLPGTRIPIKSDDELLETLSHENVIVNLAWHIQSEIEQYLRTKGFMGELINIL